MDAEGSGLLGSAVGDLLRGPATHAFRVHHALRRAKVLKAVAVGTVRVHGAGGRDTVLQDPAVCAPGAHGALDRDGHEAERLALVRAPGARN